MSASRRGVTYEHDQAWEDAHEAASLVRRRIKTLHFIAGGRGYDNMGRRELENARNHIDEALFWLGAAKTSLNAGGKRAALLGYQPDEDTP